MNTPTLALKYQKYPDNELVLLSIANQEYFLPLMERYQDKLLRYILRITNVCYEDAEDLLQEVFVKAYRYIYSFDHKFAFSSWIYRITRNHVISAARKRNARPQTVSYDINSFMLETIASDIALEEELDRSLFNDEVDRAIAKMDLKYREVFILRYLEDKSYEEISDILEKPINTVSTLLHRSKKQFRKYLTDQ